MKIIQAQGIGILLKLALSMAIGISITACGGGSGIEGSDAATTNSNSLIKGISSENYESSLIFLDSPIITGNSPSSEESNSDIQADQHIEISPGGTLTKELFPGDLFGLEMKTVKPMIYEPNYSEVCTRLQVNQLYNLTPVAGNFYCIYFDIPVNARTQFIA